MAASDEDLLLSEVSEVGVSATIDESASQERPTVYSAEPSLALSVHAPEAP